MDTNTKQILLRLKRRVGKERARLQRLLKDYRSAGGVGLARSDNLLRGEANVLSMAMNFIDDEIKKLENP